MERLFVAGSGLKKHCPSSMNETLVTERMLSVDVAIQYQMHRDLFRSEKRELQTRIAKEGWGARLLSYRKQDGHWGRTSH